MSVCLLLFLLLFILQLQQIRRFRLDFYSFNPWHSGHNKTDMEFDIYLCQNANNLADSNDCSNKIAVIGHNMSSQNSATTLQFANCSSSVFNSTAESEVLVSGFGGPCSVMPGETLSSFIFFKCGKKLVSTLVLLFSFNSL